ncbi:hypothetical protein D3C84_998470 [compost metagenome]
MLGGKELHQCQQRVKRKHQGNAEQHDGFGGYAATHAQKVDQQRAEHGHDERVQRHHVLRRQWKQRHPESQSHCRAKTGGSRKAQGERTGQRVVEDCLHLRTGQRQRRADRNRHQRDRQADVPHHHPHLRRRRVR